MSRVAAEHVSVVLSGGLGNQLFQYATGTQVALSHDTRLVVDTSWYRLRGINRRFQLDTFAAEYELATRLTKQFSFVMTLRGASRFPRLTSAFRRSYYCERPGGFDPEVLLQEPGVRLLGYFQSWKYFSAISQMLREQVSSISNPTSWYEDEVAWQKGLSDKVVALHIRRGDYTTKSGQKHHGVLPMSYYQKALKMLVQDPSEVVIQVFSDEPICESQLRASVGDNFHFRIVIPPPESTPVESLMLMSRPGTLVCANSTFSLWAAYLGDPGSTQVVVPGQWFRHKAISRDDLFLRSWHVID